MRSTTTSRGLVAALACAALACGACASSAKNPSRSAAAPESSGGPMDDRRVEIERLSSEIDIWRGRDGDGVAAETMSDDAPEPASADSDSFDSGGSSQRPAPMSGVRYSPPPSTRPLECADGQEPDGTTCNDMCHLARAICDNAESICRIADEIGDAWATGKCSKARETCEQATQDCCGCSSGG